MTMTEFYNMAAVIATSTALVLFIAIVVFILAEMITMFKLNRK